MEIRFVRHDDIDVERWDQTVAVSLKGLPYAYSWYLDIVSKGRWDGLVEGNYERVMPLVWNGKLLGIKQLYQPVLSQQLGVFGQSVEPGHYVDFLGAIPINYRYVQISLNRELSNTDNIHGRIRSRTNLILNLNTSYDSLRAAYSKSLRKRLKKASGELHLQESGELDLLVAFYRDHLESKVQLGRENYPLIRRLIREIIKRDQGEIYEVRDGEDRLCCIGFFIKTNRRIINVFGASDGRGKALYAMHFMLDQVILRYAARPLIFDFEGSDIPGVAEFFRSFGSKEEFYSEYALDRLPVLIRMIRERRLPKFNG